MVRVRIMVSLQEMNISPHVFKNDGSWQVRAVYSGRMVSQRSYTGCVTDSKPPSCAVKLV